jgi:hypothetical protein
MPSPNLAPILLTNLAPMPLPNIAPTLYANLSAPLPPNLPPTLSLKLAYILSPNLALISLPKSAPIATFPHPPNLALFLLPN